MMNGLAPHVTGMPPPAPPLMARPPSNSNSTTMMKTENNMNNSNLKMTTGQPPAGQQQQQAAVKKPAVVDNAPEDERDCGKWSKEEDMLLKKAVDNIGARNWKRISTEYLGGKRSDVQCLHRWQKVLKPGLIKGPWTKEEDETIMEAIKSGVTKWSEIATLIPGRIGKQCRERWFNHLDPSIKKGGWTEEEDRILVEYQEKLGNRWCEIAKVLPGRSENAVKNRWNSAMRRKYQQKKKQGTNKPLGMGPFANAGKNSGSSSSTNVKARNSIRLPPQEILVEQPTNRNSVIAAREKIIRHQEQIEKSKKLLSNKQQHHHHNHHHRQQQQQNGFPNHQQQSMMRSSSDNLASAKDLNVINQMLREHAHIMNNNSNAKSFNNNGENKYQADGENCRSLSNTGGHGNNNNDGLKSTSMMDGSQKRAFGSDNRSGSADEESSTKSSRKRAKVPKAKLSKGVANLLNFEYFENEMKRRKAFSKMNLTTEDHQALHELLQQLVNEATETNTALNVNIVWATITEKLNNGEFVPVNGMAADNGSVSGTRKSSRRSAKNNTTPLKNKPKNLQVQCSFDPSSWTLNGGTPTMFGAQTPVSEMLNLMNSSSTPFAASLNPSIFSPTPRGGGGLFAATPLHQSLANLTSSLQTPTAAEIKNSLDDSLLNDSLFLNMDGNNLTLNIPSLNLSNINGVPVMSPLFSAKHSNQ